MAWVGGGVGTALIVFVLIDAFEAMILPRRVRHRFRLARLYYQAGWALWRRAAHLLRAGTWRQGFLGVFGPLSLFGLLYVWASGLIVGFAALQWSLGTLGSRSAADFSDYLYFSGTTFFTLGYGDLVAADLLGRGLSVFEASVGFGLLAVVVSYLPVLYQAFSRREIIISLLDARAGSPPSACEFLRRLGGAEKQERLVPLLAEWERWAAEVLESHLSYPVLRFYRSQHDNQSWVGTLAVILDTSALLIVDGAGAVKGQAQLTFAMARHAAADLLLATRTPPMQVDRLPAAELARLRASLRDAGIPIRDGPEATEALTALRGHYEPLVAALAAQFLFTLPSFVAAKPPVDNWQTSPWLPPAPGFHGQPAAGSMEDHFD